MIDASQTVKVDTVAAAASHIADSFDAQRERIAKLENELSTARANRDYFKQARDSAYDLLAKTQEKLFEAEDERDELREKVKALGQRLHDTYAILGHMTTEVAYSQEAKA